MEAEVIRTVMLEWAKGAGPDDESSVAIIAVVGFLLKRYRSSVTINKVRNKLDKLAKEAMRLDTALATVERRIRPGRRSRVEVRFAGPTVNPRGISDN